MLRYWKVILTVTFSLLSLSIQAQDTPPTVADFWDGTAEWVMDIEDVGLPIGESDTVSIGDGVYHSYLHASDQSAGVIDQCGMPVEFPGCLTLWESADHGETFNMSIPVCLMSCESCPCDDQRDHITAQQYPRVAVADDGTWYMAYEWHAQTILRQSQDGMMWSDWTYLRTPAGTWHTNDFPCSELERIGSHPNIQGEVHNCLLGAPPGIYIDGDMLYIFVSAGSAPGHMRCYKGNRFADLGSLQVCDNDPLFAGASEYGDIDLRGSDAHAYFDFRYVSSAEVTHIGEHYYMFYEGIRGPEELEIGSDTQFALGLARSVDNQIDGTWEKFDDNPILMDMQFNWGVGHADLVVIEGVSYLYTATSTETRGRYRLDWLAENDS